MNNIGLMPSFEVAPLMIIQVKGNNIKATLVVSFIEMTGCQKAASFFSLNCTLCVLGLGN